MSCENTDELRIITKYSSFPGEEPTIPISGDHNDGTWLPTDLYVGEMFINVADNKAWVRGMDGIFQIGATGGSFSFTGDYVYKSTGGTYSGNVYAPTFSSIGVVTQNIEADIITATYFVGGSFIGDGSGLTGINANWLGGSVSNPSSFSSNLGLYGPVVIDGTITSGDNIVDICSDVNVGCGYGVSASYFIGDGSQLTNLPIGTYSNFYTISATLSGNEIQFNRNDLAPAYSVDLTPLLSTYSVSSLTFDGVTNELTLTYDNGNYFSALIDSFQTLSVVNDINADTIYANNFYGVFNGTYSNDIYTTSANLYGTDAVFQRTDGSTYSLDLSTLSGGGSGSVGPTGPTGATGATGSNGLTPYMAIAYNSTGLTLATGSVTLPVTTTLLIGWAQGTRVRIWNDATHYMEGQITTAMTYPQVAGNDIVVNVDYVVGTGTFGVWRVGVAGDLGGGGAGASQSLAQTLSIGNTTGTHSIYISSSASKIEGYNGISQHWYDASNFFGDYFQIENGTGSSASFIKLFDNKTGNIHIAQNNMWDLSSADAYRTWMYMSGNTQITTEERDFVGNTFWVKSSNNISSSGTTTETRDLLNDTSAAFSTYTDMTGADTWSYIQSYENGGLNMGQIYVYTDRVNLRAEDNGVSFTNIELNYTDIVVSGTPSFGGVKYDRDYSTNYTNRSLVDKEYVDAVAGGGATPSLSVVLTQGNNTGNNNIELNNNPLSGTSDNIVAIGNTFDDAKFSFEDLGSGTEWAPTMRVDDNDTKNYITVAKTDTYIHSSQVGGLINRYSQVKLNNGASANVEISSQNLANGEYSLIRTRVDGNLVLENHEGVRIEFYSQLLSTDPKNIIITAPDEFILQGGDMKIIGTTASFPGIKYNSNYSSNFTARSLVDKAYVDAAVAGGGGGGTFSGGTVSGATTFQSDVTFQANVIDENGTSVDMTNIINMTNLTLMYNT